ncbi:alcohol dehydrogenase-like protein [Talaromyces proteolyticus]|uniref:Alcohol dehydrogenase-like protein n=1 Tax=Talaromyces proteolyticus TaxID=1131652 RepID=A0AAD4PYV4_9EURO|nr:alcohol dehydrogenase-like protein [Talaromyces proteolyticus]KAH8698366.1 alcohol dehydrogenase-like protein [Talaromyces proteolyticus]
MNDIPKTQKAIWVQNPGPNGTVALRSDIPTPQPGDGEMLVKIQYSGICGSDLRNLHGMSKYTSIPGHEGVGTVVQLGPNVSSWYLHRRVGIKWVWRSCGSCSLCRKGEVNHCPAQLNTSRSVHGTLQEYALARPEFSNLIPEALRSEDAAPLLCAGHTLAGAVSKLDRLGRGDAVVVLGAGGGLGHLGVQMVKMDERGLKVIAVDAGEEKGMLCRELGAEEYINIESESDIETRVKELTDGEGAQGVIIVSGAEEAFRLAPRLVRNGGTIVVVGLPRNDFQFPMAPIEISARGLTVIGTSVGTEKQMEELLESAARGLVVPRIEVYALEDAPRAFEKLVKGEVVGRCVVRVSE